MRPFDVIVIGGGIIGCSVASELKRHFKRVCLVERGEPGQAASIRAAGILAPHASPKRTGPFLRLCRAALERYPAWIERLQKESGTDVEYKRKGLLYCAFTDSDEEFLTKKFEWQSEAGIQAVRFSREEALRMEPRLSEELRWAVFFPDDQQVDNVRLMQALIVQAAKLGVVFVNARPATEVRMEHGRVIGVLAGTKRVEAPTVVVAAGCWSGLGLKLPFDVPVEPAKGQIVILEHHPPLFEKIVQSRRAYLVTRNDGRIVCGSTVEFVGFDTTVTAKALNRIVRGALEASPELARARFRDAWAGLRPCSADRLPILGGTDVEGLFFATGHFRNGILLAPITAQLIRELILEEATSLPIESFLIDRFRLKRETATL